MSTLDTTVSMLKAMPEGARIKVLEYTKNYLLPENRQIHLSQSARNRFFPILPSPASKFPMTRLPKMYGRMLWKRGNNFQEDVPHDAKF